MLLIPQSWVTGLREWSRQSLPLMLWRGFLVLAITLLFILSALNGYVLATTVLGIVFSIVYADDIRATWRDLWNLDFYGT